MFSHGPALPRRRSPATARARAYLPLLDTVNILVFVLHRRRNHSASWSSFGKRLLLLCCSAFCAHEVVLNCGAGNRTRDLRRNVPALYHCATPPQKFTNSGFSLICSRSPLVLRIKESWPQARDNGVLVRDEVICS